MNCLLMFWKGGMSACAIKLVIETSESNVMFKLHCGVFDLMTRSLLVRNIAALLFDKVDQRHCDKVTDHNVSEKAY